MEGRVVPAQVNLTVSSLADSGAGSLRAAILAADAGSSSDKFTIGFAVSGTIDLQSPLPDLSNSITIQGPGAGSLTVERAAGATIASALVTVDVGQTASLSGLTIANSSAGGIINSGTLSVSNSALSGNSAVDAGGGIFNAGTLTVSGSTLSGNSTTPGGDGGGIYNSPLGTVTISQSTLSGNSANDKTLPDGTVFIGEGGAIANFGGTMTVVGCTLSGNSAGIGGAIGSSNGSINIGGSDYYYFGTVTVRDSLFTSNSAVSGGAIYNDSTLVVRGSTFSGNTATLPYNSAIFGGYGGGLFTGGIGTATLQECNLSGNTAGTGGGGIFDSGTLAIKDSTVTGNSAPAGADLFALGAVTIDDSTVGVRYGG
jgi:predicted outer membrane repeat protein